MCPWITSLLIFLTIYPTYRGAAMIKTGTSPTPMQDIVREQCFEQITVGIFTTIWVSAMKEKKGEGSIKEIYNEM